MKTRIRYFRESIRLVWKSAPSWTMANVIISVLRSFLPLALIWLIKELIDIITKTTSSGQGTISDNILWLIIAVAVLWFLDEAASGLDTYVRKKQSMKLEDYMYGLLHSKAIKLDLINFERSEYFDALSRASREAPWRPNSILNNVVALCRGCISLILMAGVLTFLNWWIAVLLLVINIPGIWLRLHFTGILYSYRLRQTPEARKTAYFNWLLTGERPSREIRLFGLGDYFISLFRKSYLKTQQEELDILKKRTLIELVSDVVKASAVLVTLLIIAGKTVKGDITLGLMAMFLLAFRQGMVYIKDFLGSLAGLYEDSVFVGDVFEFLSLEENIKALPPETELTDLRHKLEVDKLCFTYPGNKTRTINNVSFEIKKGEIIALVGPNGAGKSTLARLLCRLYDPESGSVKCDGTDIRHLDPKKYRKLLSVVFQDFMLYNMSAGENIRMGNIDIEMPDEKIVAAAKVTGIDKLIKELPEGYSTPIGTLFENSRELSWGEWQKIALARAIFREAPLLILDEPSSALDAETEYDIFNRFHEIVKGRTSILISHRFTNVCLADRIIVLDRGAIVESGTHEELMKRKGLYHTMYTKQSSRFDK